MAQPVAGLVHVSGAEGVCGDDIHALLDGNLKEALAALQEGNLMLVREAGVDGFGEATWADGDALLHRAVSRAPEDRPERAGAGVCDLVPVHLAVEGHELHRGCEAKVNWQTVQGLDPCREAAVRGVSGRGPLLAAKPVEPGAEEDAVGVVGHHILLVRVVRLAPRAEEARPPAGAELDRVVHGRVPGIRATQEPVKHQGLADAAGKAPQQEHEARHVAVAAHVVHDIAGDLVRHLIPDWRRCGHNLLRLGQWPRHWQPRAAAPWRRCTPGRPHPPRSPILQGGACRHGGEHRTLVVWAEPRACLSLPA
mmetsp:Transcript_6146/g.18392  ORF Transcript_6146/g.18392 Transcript_6146/m.18392 type:complete len:309 (-) Transcript_6146:10-936(-)